ncbi:MAG: tetratricopeptide repeat protein [Chloroflexi bacterium]|nr:tetratricopeptide repeat protein [Chloroflexota bacterium]
MGLVQRLLARALIGRRVRELAALIPDPGCPPDRLVSAFARAEVAYQASPRHYGLAFLLGRASQCIAAELPWHDRTAWYRRALEYFESAARLAEAGNTAGADGLPEVSAHTWGDDLDLQHRAWLAASFEAGVLAVGEFRIRDPARAVHYLRRVAETVRGAHPVWYYLGEAYLLVGEFDAAEAAWREGLARAPDDRTLQAVLRNLPADRVRHAVRDGDWLAARRALERLPEGAMPTSERLTIEGDVHLAMGDPEAARRCWIAALEADPHAVGVRRRLHRLARGGHLPPAGRSASG